MLYCIFSSNRPQPAPAPRGLEGRPVEVITRNGLRGVCSGHESPSLPAVRPNLLAYKRVVDFFHQHLTVIPVRYGAVFDTPHGITHVLTDQGDRFQRLLERMDGCVEMGIRILLAPPGKRPGPPDLNETPWPAQGPGRAYLNARRARYEEEARVERSMKALAAACRGWFPGLFTAFREEFSGPGIHAPRPGGRSPLQGQPAEGLISLYFLVPRHAVERFVRRFHKAARQRPERFLLSGPWPAYNFVS